MHRHSYRARIQQQVVAQKASASTAPSSLPEIVSDRSAFDDEFYASSTNKFGNKSANDGEDYDSEAELICSSGGDSEQMKKQIEPLPRVDHSSIVYQPFKKNLYRESAAIANWSADGVEDYRQENDISVSAADDSIQIPKPLRTFAEANFDLKLRQEIERMGFQAPTPIQSQAIPIALSGLDILGLAKTGSGKTLAYFWPMLLHILAQPQVMEGEGPIGLILAPTRELVQQIYQECRKFTKLYHVHIVAIYGGAGKWEMTKQLKNERPELVVATPGRFIDLIKSKATNLKRCTMVILDEADRMFELGFEYQMRSIVQNIRPDRQVLLFSATMKKKIESFAREMLHPTQHVRVVIGVIGQANPDIHQLVQIVSNEEAKWLWLATEIDSFAADGKVLIFTMSKADTEVLKLKLQEYLQRRALDIVVDTLHGDKDSYDRRTIMKRFAAKTIDETVDVDSSSRPVDLPNKKSPIAILIATDIAARGLDVHDIRTVINFDVPKNIETYVHRIGRTGRMHTSGVVPGTAYTLLTQKDTSFAVDLVQNLRLSQQPVSSDLLQLAQRDAKWHRIKHFSGSSGHSIGNRSYPNNRGGLGEGSYQRAMTSAMAAADGPQHHHSNPFSNSSGMEGSNRSQSVLPTGVARLVQPSSSVDTTVAEAELKEDAPVRRKSRFDSANSATHGISSSSGRSSSSSSVGSGPVLKGFVRANNTGHNLLNTHVVASAPATASITPISAIWNTVPEDYVDTSSRREDAPDTSTIQRKRSRWDT